MNDINIVWEHAQPSTTSHTDICLSFFIRLLAERMQTEQYQNKLALLNEKKLLTIGETADLFGVGRNKIYELTNADDCPFVLWIGGHRKIKREAFESYIMKQYSV